VTHASLSRSLVSSRFIISQRRRNERDGKERESLRDEFDRSIERERERERERDHLVDSIHLIFSLHSFSAFCDQRFLRYYSDAIQKCSKYST
jgi:hypothetical protein